MAPLRSAAPKHARWLEPSFPSYAPGQGGFGPPHGRYVGALSAQGVLELGKQGIDVSDQVVRDLDIPVMQEALDLLDKVYWTADQLGVGPEVRTAITAIRGAEYAGVAASAVVPASAAAAGTGVFLGIGAVAALGAVGAIGAALGALFGGGDDEAAQAAVKRAQAEVLHLRDRLTVSELAAEQDDAASAELALSLLPFGAGPVAHKSAAARAQKLASFYRALPARLTKGELALFVSLSNLARWTVALRSYDALPQSNKDALDVMFGKSAPRLPYQLKAPMAAEAQKLAELTASVQAERAPGLGLVAVLAAAAGLGLYAAISPRGAAALAKSSASVLYRGGASVVRKARGIV